MDSCTHSFSRLRFLTLGSCDHTSLLTHMDRGHRSFIVRLSFVFSRFASHLTLSLSSFSWMDQRVGSRTGSARTAWIVCTPLTFISHASPHALSFWIGSRGLHWIFSLQRPHWFLFCLVFRSARCVLFAFGSRIVHRSALSGHLVSHVLYLDLVFFDLTLFGLVRFVFTHDLLRFWISDLGLFFFSFSSSFGSPRIFASFGLSLSRAHFARSWSRRPGLSGLVNSDGSLRLGPHCCASSPLVHWSLAGHTHRIVRFRSFRSSFTVISSSRALSSRFASHVYLSRFHGSHALWISRFALLTYWISALGFAGSLVLLRTRMDGL